MLEQKLPYSDFHLLLDGVALTTVPGIARGVCYWEGPWFALQ